MVDCYQNQGKAYPGGNEYNVSIFARRLGAQAAFIGCFGKDFYSGANYSLALQAGVDLSRCRHYPEECGMAMVTLEQGDRTFLGSNNGGVTGRHPVRLDEADLRFLEKYDITVSDRYSRMAPAEFAKLAAKGIPLAYDFGDEEPDELTWAVLPHCTVAFFSCSHRKDQEIDDRAQKGLAAGCRAVVMTMGARGARTYARGMDDPVCCAARVGPVLDTMGAGDSFLTAFLVTAIQKFALAPQGSGEWMECMQAGTQFAFENCGFYGSIGYGLPCPQDSEYQNIQFKRR